MKRFKQIWTDEETHRKAKSKASQKGLSLNDYFKELVSDEEIITQNVKKKKPFKFQI